MNPQDIEKVAAEVDSKCTKGWGDGLEKEHTPAVNFLLNTIETSRLENARVVEIGCGTGWILRSITDKFNIKHGLGLDISQKMINEAKKKSEEYSQLEFKKAGWDELPSLSESKFDAIFSVESIYWHPNPTKCLKNAYNSLKPEGILALDIECYTENSGSADWDSDCNVNLVHFSKEEYKKIIEETGFKNIKITQFKYPEELASEPWMAEHGTLIITANK